MTNYATASKKLLPTRQKVPHQMCRLQSNGHRTNSNKQETYKGLTENEFKTRFNLHKSSFKLEHKRTTTTLSDHIRKLKKKNTDFNIKLEMVKRVKPHAPGEKGIQAMPVGEIFHRYTKTIFKKRTDKY